MVNRSKKPLRPLTNIPLKESPGLFKKFIESASEAFVLLDENLNCLSINQAGARLLGMPQSELIGRNILDVVPDAKKSGRYDKYMNVIKTGESFYSDELIPSPKFGDKRLIVRAFKTGKGMGMIVNDTTSLRKAEELLRKSEHDYKVLFNSSIEGMFVIDAETMKVVLANEAGKEMALRYGVKDVTSIEFLSYIPPDSRDGILKIIVEDMFEKDLRQVNEFRIVTPDGEEIWLSAVGTRIEYQGKPAGLVSVRDITQRKQVEEALRRSEELLRESEERYRDIVENSLDGIYQVDTSGKFLFVNESFARTFGYKRNELIRKHFSSMLDAETLLNIEKMVGDVFLGKNVLAEVPVQHKDGYGVPVSFSATPLKREGKIIGLSGILKDVTERRRIEEELRSLSSYLQQAREQERALIARQIHDELGQALTALKMDLSWLNNRLNTEQEPLLGKTRAMLRLTDRAIQTVRTLSSELSPKLIEDLGLEAALDWLTEEFQNRTGIECKLTLKSKDIALEPERATAVFRIFQEALTNIARHANATKVKVSLRETDSKFVFRIVDNGKGITREQVSNPRSFGLMGMRERARFCGGEVEITGSQDKGTAVIVRIPLNKEEPR